jgi:hypothetical protein
MLFIINMYYLNVIKDYTLGYIETKCCYSKCNRTIKISRNTLQPGIYSCNIGCALASYNDENKNN